MLQPIVDKWMQEGRARYEATIRAGDPENYREVVRAVVAALDCDMDPERIEMIDWGDYQGTLVFVIGAKGYQPYEFWTVKVGYGSCSGCDTLEDIKSYGSKSMEQKMPDYLTLGLHIVQRLREVE